MRRREEKREGSVSEEKTTSESSAQVRIDAPHSDAPRLGASSTESAKLD